MLKKILKPSFFILTLLLFSLLFIGFLVVRENIVSPEAAFAEGKIAENASQFRKAEKYYLKATESQVIPVAGGAYYRLARLYKKGTETFPQNYQKAADYLAKAGERENMIAAYELALLYDVGDKIPENRAEAVKWMDRAAAAGYPNAQYAKAIWMQRGYYGETDRDEVVRLLTSAADKNHLNAMTSLVVIYTDGYGTFPENIRVAQELKAKIEAQGRKK